MIPGFEAGRAKANGQEIAYAKGGSGAPVLLLHGFPQTNAMWHQIAPVLAQSFTVIAADLRGYGESSKPQDPAAYGFRDMAQDQVALMEALGYGAFHVIGHDRGGRTAHRMALDHPERLRSLAVLDIVPTHLLLADLTKEVAAAYYHWFFLAQPSPLPERMIGADPDAYFESCLGGWGAGALEDFDATALDLYRKSWRNPDTIQGMCNDYRAALTLDFGLDAADLDRQVTCPTLVLYGADGAMGRAYDVPATWADRLADMTASPMPGGHFFPDTHPEPTAAVLLEFLQDVHYRVSTLS